MIKISRKAARELVDFMTNPDTIDPSQEAEDAVKRITTALDEAQGAWDDPETDEESDEVIFSIQVTEE